MITTHPAHELVARYRPQLDHLLFNNRVPPHEWPDLKQELRIRLWKAIDAGKLEGWDDHFTFVYTVLRHLIINRGRRLRARRAFGHELSEHIERAAGDRAPSPLDILARADEHQRLRDAVERLPARYREALEHMLQDRPMRELAERFDTELHTVKVWAFRGRQQLRKALSP